MRKMKNWLLGSGLFGLMIVLSGCVTTDKNGHPKETGIIYRFLVKPMSALINLMVENFDWSYGLAVIMLTVVIRLIILPLGISQARKSMIQSEKMQAIKPQLDAAQANMKAATTPEEQMAAQKAVQQVYKDNNVSMLGGIGCLPLLIQMPIFSALYFTARYGTGISSSTFMGMDLGKPSMILVVIVGVAYLGQSLLSLVGVPEAQKKTMRTMLIASPLMIVFMSFSSPAGVALYWVVGGVFSCIQTFITNIIMKPRVRRKLEEELKKNPPKIVTPIKKAEPVTPAKPVKQINNSKPKNGRNAGKQQHRN
jgi:YidC/Oxa1 family membrane protein insertase